MKDIHTAIDAADGFTDRKRGAAYQVLCDLASHPTTEEFWLIKPGGDAVIGPFSDPKMLRGTVSELGRVVAQAGTVFTTFSRTTSSRTSA